jgi:hypothetical protein
MGVTLGVWIVVMMTVMVLAEDFNQFLYEIEREAGISDPELFVGGETFSIAFDAPPSSARAALVIRSQGSRNVYRRALGSLSAGKRYLVSGPLPSSVVTAAIYAQNDLAVGTKELAFFHFRAYERSTTWKKHSVEVSNSAVLLKWKSPQKAIVGASTATITMTKYDFQAGGTRVPVDAPIVMIHEYLPTNPTPITPLTIFRGFRPTQPFDSKAVICQGALGPSVECEDDFGTGVTLSAPAVIHPSHGFSTQNFDFAVVASDKTIEALWGNPTGPWIVEVVEKVSGEISETFHMLQKDTAPVVFAAAQPDAVYKVNFKLGNQVLKSINIKTLPRPQFVFQDTIQVSVGPNALKLAWSRPVLRTGFVLNSFFLTVSAQAESSNFFIPRHLNDYYVTSLSPETTYNMNWASQAEAVDVSDTIAVELAVATATENPVVTTTSEGNESSNKSGNGKLPLDKKKLMVGFSVGVAGVIALIVIAVVISRKKQRKLKALLNIYEL